MSTPRPPLGVTERLLRKLEREGALLPRPAVVDAAAVATPPVPDDEVVPPLLHDIPGLPRPQVPELSAGEPTIGAPTPPPRTRPKAPTPQKSLTEQILDLGHAVNEDVEAFGRVAQQAATGRAGPGEAAARTGAALAGLDPEEVFPEVRAKPGDVGKAVRILAAAALPPATASQLAFGTILRSRAWEPSPLAASYERGVAPDAFAEQHPGLALLADVAVPGGGAGDAAKLVAGAGKRVAAKLGEKVAEEAALRPGRASLPLVATLAGGGAGAAIGGTVGDTPEERIRNAVVGGLTGAALVGGGAAVAARAGREAESAATRAVDRAVEEDVARGARGGQAAEPAVSVPDLLTPTSAIDADDFAHIRSFGLDPTGEKRLREKVAEIVAREGLAPKKTVSWAETRQEATRLARELGVDVDAVDEKAIRKLHGPELLALRSVVSDNITAVEKLSRRLTDPALSEAERAQIEATIRGLDGQTDALLSRFIRSRSAAGRVLNSLKIVARHSMDPGLWLAKAKQLAGPGGYSEEVRTNIMRFINAGDRAGLVKYVAELRKAPVSEKVLTLWKAGLLTNPKTHAVNLLSNTTMAALETLKDNPAALFDRIISLGTGIRTKSPTSLLTLKASARGAAQGVKEAREILKGTPLPDALERFEIPKETVYRSALLNAYTQGVFRTLGAEDRVFRSIALQRSLAEQAQALARAEGLTGKAAAKRAEELIVSPSDEMAARAIADAEVATFRDQTAVGSALSGFTRPLGPVGEVLLPFRRTPAAVASRVGEYSPIGFGIGTVEALRVWRAAMRGVKLPEAQKRAAEVLGRASIGTAPLVVGWWLWEHGKATGAMPASASERGAWSVEGRQPNSVLIDGRWENVGRISPVGNLLSLGANLAASAHATDEGPAARLGELAASTARTVADQPFVQGLTQAVEAVGDPQRAAARLAENLVGSIVPAGVAAVARAIDPVARDGEGVTGALLARIPGASKLLPARLNAFGEPIQREPGGIVTELLNPLSPRAARGSSDPLVLALEEYGVGLAPLTKRKGETPEAFRERQADEGRYLRAALEATVRSEEYTGAEEWAEAALRDHPERLQGYTIPELVKWRRKELLENAIRRARASYTRAEKN